jgi:hypothetical protein
MIIILYTLAKYLFLMSILSKHSPMSFLISERHSSQFETFARAKKYGVIFFSMTELKSFHMGKLAF